MKKIGFIVLSAILAMGCYEDKGSYDYRFDELNEIKKVTFTPEGRLFGTAMEIEFKQPVREDKTERLNVDVTQTLGTNLDNLDFYWLQVKQKDGKTWYDTLSKTKGYYDVFLPKGRDTLYNVMLEIKDRETTLSHFTAVKIKTRPIYKNSLFILHGKQGSFRLGNIEHNLDKTSIKLDAYKEIYPEEENPFRNSIGLVYSTFYNSDKRKDSNNLLAINSDGEAYIYEPFGLKLKYSSDYTIPKVDKPYVHGQIIETGNNAELRDNKILISKNGSAFFARTILSFKIPGENSKDELHVSDYDIKAGVPDEDNFILWDDKSKNFLYASGGDNFPWNEDEASYSKLNNPLLNAAVNLSPITNKGISLDNITAVYAYLQYTNSPYSNPFFIFKDKTTNKYYLAELNSLGGGKDDKKTRGDDGKDKDKGKDDGKGKDDDKDKDKGKDKDKDKLEPRYSITFEEMENFNPREYDWSIRYNTWFTTNTLFYTDGKKVYRYNASSGDNVEIYTAPEGYNISVMKFRSSYVRFLGGQSGNYDSGLGRYLSIGMNKGDNGAIAELRLTTASDVDPKFPIKVYKADEDGNEFGNIKDVVFAHIYTYSEL